MNWDNDDDFTKTIEDLYDSIVGVGVEVEALVTLVRPFVARELGYDPLEGAGYDDE